MEDRFFLEVFSVETSEKMTSSFTFLARSDKIARLVETTTVGVSSNVDILVPVGESKFRLVHDLSISFDEAESAGFLQCFGRIILKSRQ